MASRVPPPVESSGDENEDTFDLEDNSLPQKKYYRQRAHVNPLSIQNLLPPVSPSAMEWEEHFPDICGRHVEFLDVGCGYGGLLISLSTLFPDKYILGRDYRL